MLIVACQNGLPPCKSKNLWVDLKTEPATNAKSQLKLVSFGYLKDYFFFIQLQLYDSGVAFGTMYPGKHGHCHSKDWVLNHRMCS